MCLMNLGMVSEMTFTEKYKIYHEMKKEYELEDITTRMAEMFADEMEVDELHGLLANEQLLNKIHERFSRSRASDAYWEAYWLCCEDAIMDVIKEEKKNEI